MVGSMYVRTIFLIFCTYESIKLINIYDRGFRKPWSLAIGQFKVIAYSNRGDEDGHFGPGIKV